MYHYPLCGFVRFNGLHGTTCDIGARNVMLDDEVNVLLTFITYRYDLITAKCSLGLAMALIPERANFLPPRECYG